MTDGELVTVESSALREITAAEVDIQITTAKRFPRDLKKVRMAALSLATTDQDIARSCFYVLRRGGKNIEGPGVRLAEIVASQWGNLRLTSLVVEVGTMVVRARGMAHDLEKNVAYSSDVSVRITGKDGKRYSEDMIVVSGNAACAKALRNVIFKAVPFAYIKPIYEAAKKCAVGDATTVNARKAGALAKFKELDITQEQLVTYLGINSWEDAGLYELETLVGTITSIEDGTTTIQELFFNKPVKQTEAKPEVDPATTPAPPPPQPPPPATESAPPAEPAASATDPIEGLVTGSAETPSAEKKKGRGRPKKTVAEAEEPKTPEQPQDPGATEPPPAEKVIDPGATGYAKFRQTYNVSKARLCEEFGTTGTNDFIFSKLNKLGKDLSKLSEDEWTNLIAQMDKHLEGAK